MMSAADSIRELALPVVMISANGLICLALYNRLAAVTSRFRMFGREHFDVQIKLLELEADVNVSALLLSELRARLIMLRELQASLLKRAKLVRDALMLLLTAVMGMLLTSLLLGATQEIKLPNAVPMIAFVTSVLVMMCGICFAVRELQLYWEQMQIEDCEQTEVPARQWSDHETAAAG